MPPSDDLTAAKFVRSSLSPRERTVLLAVGQRLTNGEIADILKVSKRTVESHIAALFTKLGVSKRLDLIALAATDTAQTPPTGLVGTSELMWRELVQLRRKLRRSTAETALDRACGVLFERYRLPTFAVAAQLLHIVAVRHGFDVVALARAVLVGPRPEDGQLFPHPDSGRGPELTFVPGAVSSRSQVLTAALAAAMDRADTGQGDLQLVPAGGHGLDIVAARGFTKAFVTQFAHVDGDSTACAVALSTREPVSVPDVTRSEIYQPIALDTLTAERVRAVYSTPLLAGRRGVGVVSVHGGLPGRLPSRATRGELTRIALQTGAWLGWQRRTARLDALADLHERARRYPATPED